MKKVFPFLAIFISAGVLLWAFPFFSVALSAPTQDVDLEIGMSGDPDPVTAGNTLTYTLAVTNSGDIPATGVVITDTLPGMVSFYAASPPCNFVTEVGQVRCDLAGLDALASASMTITVQVNPSARVRITNTARVVSLDTDIDLSNNISTETTTINASTDLGINKSDEVVQVTAGESVSYTFAITVTNGGPSLASGVVVTDTWPVSFTRGLVSLSEGTCDTQTSPTEFTCDVGDIQAGGQQAITVTYSVPAGTPSGTQTNTVEASSAEASAPVSAGHANAVVTSADLGIVKSDNVSQVIAGDSVPHRYAIAVTNGGPSLAHSVVVTDTWPVGFTRGLVQSSNGTCNTLTSPTDFTCAVGNIAVGERRAITVTYSVPAGTPAGAYINTAEANSVDASALITATDSTNVTTRADLSLSKLDNPDPVNSGETLTYTLTVANNGPSNATGVVISDTLPLGTTFNDPLSSTSCDAVGRIVTCNLGGIAAGGISQALIKVTVNTTTAGAITNRASVTATTFDPATGNNHAQVSTTVDVGNPVVNWIQPVPNDSYFYIKCFPVCPTVHFQVNATDDVGVQRVVFNRWDHVLLTYVDIGTDTTFPYTWEFNTSILPIGFNQIFAEAFDTLGHKSLRKRIFLVKLEYTFLPVVRK